MKDFQIVNRTKLLFRNDPLEELANLTKNKKVLFVYGGGSVHKNGCYDDVKNGVLKGKGEFFEIGNVSRDITSIEKAVNMSKEKNIDLLIGAGGANVMDATKVIALGHYNANYYEAIKEGKNIDEMRHLPLILIPTYPSSGSEYDSCAVAEKNGELSYAFGIFAEYSLLVPKYSVSLNHELTSYSSLVTLIQVSVYFFGDKNPISRDLNLSVVKNILKSAEQLKTKPDDLIARSVVLYGASISTSEWIGSGRDVDYASDFFCLEIIIELLFNETYRKCITVLFPYFLKFIAKTNESDVKIYLKEVFNLDGKVDDSVDKLIKIFEGYGIDMSFHSNFSDEKLAKIPNGTTLSFDDIKPIIKSMIK